METKQVDSGITAEAVQSLITLSRIDTLYGDLYLQRAKDLLNAVMPFESYRGLLRMEGELNSFPNRIENAMMQEKWQAVQELTDQWQRMKESAEKYRGTFGPAKMLYQQDEIAIDPFSPGMLAIVGKPTDLRALRETALSLLASLQQKEPGWKGFYATRLKDFAAEIPISVVDPSVAAVGRSTPERLQQEALEALTKGNLDKLRELAGALSQSASSPGGAGAGMQDVSEKGWAERRFDFSFAGAVVERAARLGLAPYNVEPRIGEYAKFAPFIWRPTFADIESEQGRALRLSALPLPPDTPEALRTRIEMFVLHPFINSAGVRFLPPLVEEDALVEDFPEPEGGGEMKGSPLLEALGLSRRNSLTRMQIEEALALRGYDVVKDELGLDPVQFRLVSIPPDLHLRIGMKRGWGTRQIWTHFDGYMLTASGRISALAGGDARFGGIYDIVGIGRNYDSDRIIARFAVVQRQRMARLLI